MTNSETSLASQLSRRRTNILGLEVDVANVDAVLDALPQLTAEGGAYICFANVHMVMEAYDDPAFRSAVNRADLVVADGMPLVWMQRSMGQRHAGRVRGNSTLMGVLRRAEADEMKVGFYGSSDAVLDLIKQRVATELPKLKVSYAFSPPFRQLTPEEDANIVRNINDAHPDILFVGLGCPKQEMWMAEHRDRLNCVMLGVGAAFDFYAGTVPESPDLLGRLGLEWVYRLLREPRRLWRRYLSTNPRFVILAMLQLARSKGEN